MAAIRATSKGVRIALSNAQKANWHNPKSEIDMRAELTRISEPEARQSTELLSQAIQERLDRIAEVRTKFFSVNAAPTTSVAGFFHGD